MRRQWSGGLRAPVASAGIGVALAIDNYREDVWIRDADRWVSWSGEKHWIFGR